MNWDELFAYVQANPAQTQDIFSRLSDEERKEYLAAANRWMENQPNKERNRQDNTLMGGPPELAAAGAAGMARGGFRNILDNVLGRNKKPSLGGPDTAGLKKQPNVTTKRTVEDVTEQVTGSSRKNYADPRGHDNFDYPDAETPAVSATRRKIAAKLDEKKPGVRRRK